MKRLFGIVLVLGVSWPITTWSIARAEDDTPVTIDLLTGRYISVKGDVDKFRTLNWKKDGYAGGISNISVDKNTGKDSSVSFDGHSIPQENDNDADLVYRKGDKGYMRIKYKSFRKYFDKTGGVYSRFSTLSVNDLKDKDLRLDMGDLTLEGGLGPWMDPDIAFVYDHQTKTGIKSLLSWAGAKEGTTTRNIAPVSQQVDNSVDKLSLREKKDINGVTVKGEQKAEFDYNHNFTERKWLTTTITPADSKMRTEERRPDAKLYSSSVRGEKWMLDEKTFLGVGYLYNHIRTQEFMRLLEMDKNGNLTNYTSPKQSLDADATAESDEHVWTGNINSILTPDLTFITKVKVESQSTDTSSIFPQDTSPAVPNGIADKTDFDHVEHRIRKTGQGMSLRYSGIEHTSLYVESETEQSRDHFVKDFTSKAGEGAASSPYNEERIDQGHKNSWKLGGRTVPSKHWTFTAEAGQSFENYKYNVVGTTGTGSPIDLLDAMKVNSNQAATKVTYKPFRWLQNSFRFQFRDNTYLPTATDAPTKTKSTLRDAIYTYDVSWQPTDPLMFMLSYSRDQLITKTLAGSRAANWIPGFLSSSNSWLFSSSYAASEKWSLSNTVNYSYADNYQDVGTTGLSLGTSFREFNDSLGLQFSPKKDLTLKPTYEYASYKGNPLVDPANYSAHIFIFEVDMNW